MSPLPNQRIELMSRSPVRLVLFAFRRLGPAPVRTNVESAMHPCLNTSQRYGSSGFWTAGGFATCCLLVFLPVQTALAQFINLTANLESTWHGPKGDRLHKKTVQCVVGTNAWHIKGNFLQNADVAYWLVGTNVAEQLIITSSEYVRQAEEFFSQKILGRRPPVGTPKVHYLRRGETRTRVHPSPEGQPAGQGLADVAWLAFCSGPYLKREGHQIPMPIGPAEEAWGYRDKTQVFPDKLGLPYHVELYTLEDKLVCTYEVLQSTNFLGWTIPLRFQLTQEGNPRSGKADTGPRSDLDGTVTSLSAGDEPRLPGEVKRGLQK